MMSLIEVKCPHCGAQGQILMPPVGAIIVGPCPHCEGMVVVFSGRVFPLDGDIMQSGSLEEKKEHMMEVLGVFLHERIERLLMEPPLTASNADAGVPEDASDDAGEDEDAPPIHEPVVPDRRPIGRVAKAPISQGEMDDFVRTDLQLIDNPEYFKAVFS